MLASRRADAKPQKVSEHFYADGLSFHSNALFFHPTKTLPKSCFVLLDTKTRLTVRGMLTGYERISASTRQEREQQSVFSGSVPSTRSLFDRDAGGAMPKLRV